MRTADLIDRIAIWWSDRATARKQRAVRRLLAQARTRMAPSDIAIVDQINAQLRTIG